MPLLPCCVVFSQTHIGHDKEQGPKEIKNGKGFPHAGNAGCQPMAPAVSSVFALGVGSVASSQISTALTAQTDQSQRVEKTVVQAAPIATYLQAFAFGYMVVLLSAIAATAPIMRQSPKQILAKLS